MAKKILWAVDAFSEDQDLSHKTAHILRRWALQSGAMIEPVTVLSPDQLKIPAGFFDAHCENILEHVVKEIERRSADIDLTILTTPKVLLSRDVSLRNAVDVLIAHAKKVGAELIVVGSHSQKTVSHFLFGSFAETLVLRSDIPVFIVTPRMNELGNIDQILFPTDLSPASREALDQILPVAKQWGARITLFHKIDYTTHPMMTEALAPGAFARDVADEIRRRKSEIEAWANAVRASGVEARAEVDESPGLSAWKSVIARAKASDTMIIAMASETGPVTSALIGSTTRQVIRLATCPLWIVHPRKR